MVRRTGRRPGNPDTREAILAAARTAFAEKGYDGASIRSIAGAAGVDPALVHHYFGTKDQLFLDCMNLPIDPGELIVKAMAEDDVSMGNRLVRMFIRVWDSPAGKAGAAMLRSAVGSEWTARLFREFVSTQIARRVRPHLELDPAEAPLRISLVATQMAGLGMIRYLIKLEPLASAPPEVVVAAIGPNVDRYLYGDLSDAFDNLPRPGRQRASKGRQGNRPLEDRDDTT